ncbi:hypothetical protein COLO4_05114 [Corchorus olitorius]|uniref:Uncharacterized protein n=1 Tax=Corchorus olitorius TaxID=93759 RepID=A0A1R3KRV8_9ROSI|nr:hypothetical protein COLO4_05114 [Corchorus olitorius]
MGRWRAPLEVEKGELKCLTKSKKEVEKRIFSSLGN